jgi:hypothetical protein
MNKVFIFFSFYAFRPQRNAAISGGMCSLRGQLWAEGTEAVCCLSGAMVLRRRTSEAALENSQDRLQTRP